MWITYTVISCCILIAVLFVIAILKRKMAGAKKDAAPTIRIHDDYATVMTEFVIKLRRAFGAAITAENNDPYQEPIDAVVVEREEPQSLGRSTSTTDDGYATVQECGSVQFTDENKDLYQEPNETVVVVHKESQSLAGSTSFTDDGYDVCVPCDVENVVPYKEQRCFGRDPAREESQSLGRSTSTTDDGYATVQECGSFQFTDENKDLYQEPNETVVVVHKESQSLAGSTSFTDDGYDVCVPCDVENEVSYQEQRCFGRDPAREYHSPWEEAPLLPMRVRDMGQSKSVVSGQGET
ncbi:uncharacterized protein LOC116288890 [Actinia tenebrosa]|uniref:Uncharacterized protein LOC116288890 n=1 Tax=Actinia tenebrosa TaxID=6105 RepID=A0A6P8H8P7_ACTTE|nr:uncharacterized protein LOC116288890 [Actinia tenebrosa]